MTGSGPAGLAVAGRRPSYSSRIRVERAPGQVCAAGRSENHQRAGGGIKKEICHRRADVRKLRSEISRFGRVYIPWSLWPVHSTSFTLVHFYTPYHVATCLFDPALRLFMLVGPIAGLAAVVRVCSLSRPSQDRRPSDTSLWSESPARQPRVARVVVVRPVRAAHGAAGGRFVLVVLPGPGPACQRLASAAESSVSSSCRLSF